MRSNYIVTGGEITDQFLLVNNKLKYLLGYKDPNNANNNIIGLYEQILNIIESDTDNILENNLAINSKTTEILTQIAYVQNRRGKI